METKTLLRLIKDDISHLQGITDDFTMESLPSSDEAELALVRAKALVRQLELLQKRTESANTEIAILKPAEEPKAEIPVYNPAEPEPVLASDEGTEINTGYTPTEDERAIIRSELEPLPAAVTPLTEKEIIAETTAQPEQSVAENDQEEEKAAHIEPPGESNQLVNDILSQDRSESGYQLIPIPNIWDGIGINDRILFIRELFENNSSKFEAAVKSINQLDTIQEAVNFLKLNFVWHKSEASQKFLVLVKRRFTN